MHRRFDWIITRAHAFLLLPSRQPGAAQAYLVLNGRLIHGSPIRSEDDIAAFARLTRERFSQDRDLPLRPEEIDASVILAAWLRDPDRWQGAVFAIDSPTALDDCVDEIRLALGDLQRIDPAV